MTAATDRWAPVSPATCDAGSADLVQGDSGRRSSESQVRYEFLVREQLSSRVRESFPELSITRGPVGGTALFGPVRDDAALHGLLARFANLGLEVIEMRRLPD